MLVSPRLVLVVKYLPLAPSFPLLSHWSSAARSTPPSVDAEAEFEEADVEVDVDVECDAVVDV